MRANSSPRLSEAPARGQTLGRKSQGHPDRTTKKFQHRTTPDALSRLGPGPPLPSGQQTSKGYISESGSAPHQPQASCWVRIHLADTQECLRSPRHLPQGSAPSPMTNRQKARLSEEWKQASSVLLTCLLQQHTYNMNNSFMHTSSQYHTHHQSAPAP